MTKANTKLPKGANHVGFKNLVKEILALLIAIISVLLDSLEVKKITAINKASGINAWRNKSQN